MGGTMFLESQVGHGSTFNFTVPVALGAGRPTEAPLDQSSLAGIPVLVVDDNATNRRILAETLTRWGMQPLLAESGPDAIRILDSVSSCPLVLADVHMPGMDGFELAAYTRLRAGTVTIIMLSSGSSLGDVERCRQAGVEAYLTKPVSQKELQRAILRTLAPGVLAEHRSDTDNGSSDKVARKSGRGVRILLAEDNLVNQKVVIRLLERENYEISVAGTGRQALAALERDRFHLVLMDVQMPEMDGFEAAAAIRARERVTNQHIPIVAMTAHAMTGDRERCLAAGMDGYIAKPVHKLELLTAVERFTATEPSAISIHPSALSFKGGIGDSPVRPAEGRPV